jgi:hypothetical protein
VPVAVLGHQPVVQRREVADPAVLGQPVGDGRLVGCGAVDLPGAAVQRTGRQPLQVVADRPFGQVQLSRDRALALALRSQCLDHHA